MSSLYGALFALAGGSRRNLRLVADPDAIMHSVHVDDCARACVALAGHEDRAAVAGEAFNIANARYETAHEVADVLARSYGLAPEFVAGAADTSLRSVHGLANVSQWVASQKLRALTGWRELRPSFVEGPAEYRLAYEARKVPSAP